MKPTVGRIVHYTNLGDRDGKYPPEIQAAIITRVEPRMDNGEIQSMRPTPPFPREREDDYCVSLRIFYETGDFWMKAVPFTEADAGSEGARGHWTWPARQP